MGIGVVGGTRIDAATVADQDDPCKDASSLVDAHLVDAALAVYAGPARSCSGQAEAVAKLKQRATERDAALVVARKAEGVKARQQKFALVLLLDAGSEEARRGFIDAGGDVNREFDRAQDLLDAGFRVEARKEVEKQVAAGGPIDQASDGLQQLAHGAGAHWWDTLYTWAQDTIKLVGAVTIAVILTVVVVLALLNRLWFERIRRRQKRRKTLPKNAKWPRTWWRKFTTPYLAVANVTGDDSEVFATQVRTLIRGVARSKDGGSILVATFPEADLGLSDLADIDVRLKPVAAALKFVVRRDTVLASTTVKSDGKNALRASVELSARRSSAHSQVFTMQSPDETPSTRALVGRVAGWTIFTAGELRPRVQGYDGVDASCSLEEARRQVFGTTSAESFGWFLAGVQTRLAGDAAGAREMFSKAIDQDARHARAHLNLGLTELFSADRLTRNSGVDRVRALVEDNDGPDPELPLNRMDLLLARHNLSAGYANAAFEPGSDPAVGLDLAERLALILLVEVIALRVQNDGASADRDPEIDASWLELLRDAAVVNLAVVIGRRERGAVVFPGLELHQIASGANLDRLRGYAAVLSGKDPGPCPAVTADRGLLRWIVRRVIDVADGSTQTPTGALGKDDRLSWRLLQSVHADRPPVSPVEAYNLACYFALNQQSYGLAIRYLVQACAIPSFKAWSQTDPQLAALRASTQWAQLQDGRDEGVPIVTESDLGSDSLDQQLVTWPRYLRFVTAQSHCRWKDAPTGAEMHFERTADSLRATVKIEAEHLDGVVGVELAHLDESLRRPFFRSDDGGVKAEVVLPGTLENWFEWQLFLLAKHEP